MEYNTYFNNKYSSVCIDEEKGYVANDETKTLVFPNDSLGNYFYLRLPNKVGFVYDTQYNYSDYKGGIGSKTEVVLVAVIKEDNSDQLLDNLIATLRTYKKARLILKTALYQKSYVINQELSFLSDANRKAALQRTPFGSAFVSITFDMTEIIISNKLRCIEPPCAC